MWPYWLDGAGPSTVRNSIDIDSMILLTGDNQAPIKFHSPYMNAKQHQAARNVVRVGK